MYMGVQQTFGGLARVIVPLWAGFAYDHLGKTVPFFTSAVLVGGTLLLGRGVDDGRAAAVRPDDTPGELKPEQVGS